MYESLENKTGFRSGAAEDFALLGYNATSKGNRVRTFRGNIVSLSSRVEKSSASTLENGGDMLLRNDGIHVPLEAASYPKRRDSPVGNRFPNHREGESL